VSKFLFCMPNRTIVAYRARPTTPFGLTQPMLIRDWNRTAGGCSHRTKKIKSEAGKPASQAS
jgi:hypothetical protein